MDFLLLAWQAAVDTVAYLFAWWLVPVWAFVAWCGLLFLGARRGWKVRVEGLLGSRRVAGRSLGALLLGLTRPFRRSEIERNLRRLREAPVGTVVYLAASHALPAYYFFLLGPLLGKDVLLSHLLGAPFFVLAAGLAWRALGGPAPGWPVGDPGGPAKTAGEEGPGDAHRETTDPSTGGPEAVRLILGELWRYAGLAGYGLLLGSLIAAYGLSRPSFLLADLPLSPLASQATGALGAAAASTLSFMWPVSNLFVGTYLWKIGLAHAGLVAFLYASPFSPQRVRLYASVLGGRGAARLTLALVLGALAAGMGVALLYGFTDLTINYKLVPEQLWRAPPGG